jgi:hypothetical protein
MLIVKVAISFAKYKKNACTVLCHTIFAQIFKNNGQNRVIRKTVPTVFED